MGNLRRQRKDGRNQAATGILEAWQLLLDVGCAVMRGLAEGCSVMPLGPLFLLQMTDKLKV